MTDSTGRRRAPARKRTTLKPWAKPFLAELARTSNVTAAAKAAGICTGTAYDERRANAPFNRAWQQALCEGYDHLEMELLQRMRGGELKPAAGAKRARREEIGIDGMDLIHGRDLDTEGFGTLKIDLVHVGDD